MAELARAIAQERVEFTDGSVADGNAEKALYSRLERLLRVMWTMALDGDLRAIRCLLEYMEGKPVQVVAASVVREGERPLTADQLKDMLSEALARVEEWRKESGTAPGDGESAGPNG